LLGFIVLIASGTKTELINNSTAYFSFEPFDPTNPTLLFIPMIFLTISLIFSIIAVVDFLYETPDVLDPEVQLTSSNKSFWQLIRKNFYKTLENINFEFGVRVSAYCMVFGLVSINCLVLAKYFGTFGLQLGMFMYGMTFGIIFTYRFLQLFNKLFFKHL
jgi:hypothetical protein